MIPDREAWRSLASGLDGVDRDVYAAAGRDPLDPILGGGPPDAPLAVFGRDPGRHEVVHGMPFIGAGGRKVRDVLHARRFGRPAPDLDAAKAAGASVFWANTVPYKPVGNKAWGRPVVRAFQPLVARYLLGQWNGVDVLALGQGAFDWFGLDDPEAAAALAAWWARADRYEGSVTVRLRAGNIERDLRVHPLPHPSPLNRTWGARFPELLGAALDRIGFGVA